MERLRITGRAKKTLYLKPSRSHAPVHAIVRWHEPLTLIARSYRSQVDEASSKTVCLPVQV